MVLDKCQELFMEATEVFSDELPKIDVTEEISKLLEVMDTDKDAMKKVTKIHDESQKAYDKMEKSIDKLVECECGK